jgi:putative DNA primase/helicase
MSAVLKHDDDVARARAVGAEVPAGPRPLPDELSPVEQLPIEALPDAFRPWVADVADRMRCPPEFIGVPMLVGASMLVARHVAVQPQARTDWAERANLWAMLVAPPGWMKSPAIKAALQPIERMEAREAERHKAEMEAFKVELLAHKLAMEAGEKKAKAELAKDRNADVRTHLTGDEPKAPIWPRYVVSDLSYEKLHSLLEENPGGLLSVRDELRGLLLHLAKEENAEARAFYLQAWSGGSATIDRIGRGTVRVPDACMSMIGGIQPGPLCSILNKARQGAGDDGMIERFLVCWPDAPAVWRDVDRWPDSVARRGAVAVFDRLDALSADGVGAVRETDAEGQAHGPGLLRLAPDARELFASWREEFMPRVQTIARERESLAAALAKFNHHVPALALVLHVVDGGTGPVTMQSVKRALALAEYFESHAGRLHGSGRRVVIKAARAILAKVRSGDLPVEFTARDVYRRDWSGLTEPETVTAALEMLTVHGWFSEYALSSGAAGGRPTVLYAASEAALHG